MNIQNSVPRETAELFWEILRPSRKTDSHSLLKQILKWTEDFSSSEWIILDESVRRTVPYYAMTDKGRSAPDDLLPKNSSDEMRILFLGLCTMHPDGFFREKALNLLNSADSGSELHFILLRLTDWVKPVRMLAEKMLGERLETNYNFFYIKYYELAVRTQRSARSGNSELLTSISRLLSSDSSVQYDSPALSGFSQKIKNEFIVNVILNKDLQRVELIRWYLQENQPFLKFRILKKCLESFTFGPNELIDLFRNPAPVRCRMLILDSLRKNRGTESHEFIKKLIFSRSSYIRKMARDAYELNEKNEFRKIYQGNLNSADYRLGSISGLSETGEEDDVIFLLDFIESEDPRIRKAAAIATAKLSASELKPVILNFLSDPETSGTAFKIISKHRMLTDNSDIERIFLNAESSQIRKNCLKLLLSSSKWDSILYMIRYLNTDGENGEISRTALDRWMKNFNRSFSSPDKTQKEKIITEIRIQPENGNSAVLGTILSILNHF